MSVVLGYTTVLCSDVLEVNADDDNDDNNN